MLSSEFPFTGIHSMKNCSAASKYGVTKNREKRKEKEKQVKGEAAGFVYNSIKKGVKPLS